MDGRSVLCEWISIGALFSFAACGVEWELPLTMDTGFFERSDALVSAPVAFPVRVAVCDGTLLPVGGGADSEGLPFWFEPVEGEGIGGMLHWILAGETDSLMKADYVFRVSAGDWPGEACGNPSVGEAVRVSRNVIPNGDFESEQIPVKAASSTFRGDRLPAHWELHDFAWRYRKLPELGSLCRLSREDVHEGEWGLKFVSELRGDMEGATEEQPALVIGYIDGPMVPLKPSTRYEFSYSVKIVRVSRGGYVSASVNYYDGEKQRLHPRQYGINRIQAAYGTVRNLEEDYLGKWVRVSQTRTTLPDVRWGRIGVSGSLAGEFYVDDFRLRELASGAPVQVSAGPLRRR